MLGGNIPTALGGGRVDAMAAKRRKRVQRGETPSLEDYEVDPAGRGETKRDMMPEAIPTAFNMMKRRKP